MTAMCVTSQRSCNDEGIQDPSHPIVRTKDANHPKVLAW
jgi:hypothetical protein